MARLLGDQREREQAEVALCAFILGRYSVFFSGSVWAWIALVGFVLVLAYSAGVLLRLIWKQAR